MPKTDPAFRPADWLFIARQAARKKYRQIFGGASGTMKHAAPLELFVASQSSESLGRSDRSILPGH